MYHDYDWIDGFSALFGDGNVVFPKRSLPLGACTVDVLNLTEAELDRLDEEARSLRFEIRAYLSGEDDASQAGLTNQALARFFSLLSEYPVYRELELQRKPSISVLRAEPDMRDRMQTRGKEEYDQMQTWLEDLYSLVPSMREFRKKAEWMLDEGFSKVTERTASGYAKCLSDYYSYVNIESRYFSDALEVEDLHGKEYERVRAHYRRTFSGMYFPEGFSVAVSFRAIPHPKTEGAFLLAEEVYFKELSTFLSLDLMRGFAAGHMPRRCEHCKRWFLLESGYDTRYCENPAPEEPGKTCRQVGAHRKETRLNGTDEIRSEFKRVANRLKGRKFRGSLTVAEWNRWMKIVQDLRDDAMAGRIRVAELRERYDGICNHREK